MAGRWRASGLATNLVPLLILLVATIADTTDPDAKDVPGASADADDADVGCAAKNLDPETGHGGWGSDEVEPPLRGNCDIDRVAAADLGTLDFAGEYKGKKPLVVTGATDAWGAKDNWRQQALKKSHGHLTINVGSSVEHGTKFGGYPVGRNNTLAEFIEFLESGEADAYAEYAYCFDGDDFLKAAPELQADYTGPGLLSPLEEGDAYRDFFVLGASGSGLVMHRHWEVWNAVVYGAKRWFLYPPGVTPPYEFPAATALDDWLDDIYPKAASGEDGVAKPTECTLRTGELLYLPEGWYHSTYNLAPTIGVARQYMPDVQRRTMEDSPMWWRQVTSKANENEDQPEDRPDTLEGLSRAAEMLPNDAANYHNMAFVFLANHDFIGAFDSGHMATKANPTAGLGWATVLEIATEIYWRNPGQYVDFTDALEARIDNEAKDAIEALNSMVPLYQGCKDLEGEPEPEDCIRMLTENYNQAREYHISEIDAKRQLEQEKAAAVKKAAKKKRKAKRSFWSKIKAPEGTPKIKGSADGCDIEVISGGLGRKEFLANYLGKKAVILTGAAAAWPAVSKWNTSAFVAEQADALSFSRTGEFGEPLGTVGLTALAKPTAELTADHPVRIADSASIAGALAPDWDEPRAVSGLESAGFESTTHFLITGAGANTAPVRGYDYWEAVVDGAKYIVTFPGNELPPLFVREHGRFFDWHTNVAKRVRLAWCKLNAGDVVYVPVGTWAATAASETSIGVRKQFTPKGAARQAMSLTWLREQGDIESLNKALDAAPDDIITLCVAAHKIAVTDGPQQGLQYALQAVRLSPGSPQGFQTILDIAEPLCSSKPTGMPEDELKLYCEMTESSMQSLGNLAKRFAGPD